MLVCVLHRDYYIGLKCKTSNYSEYISAKQSIIRKIINNNK